MRRSDREVTDITEILKVIAGCKVCRLGLWDGRHVYMVPMNFGYEYADGRLTLYFHGARSGRKYEIISDNSSVGFEMDCEHDLIAADKACEYGFHFASVMGNGRAEILTDSEEKKKALSILMKQQTGRDFIFDDRQASAVHVLKVTSEDFTCKKH